MTTSTFAIECPVGQWTEVHDGSGAATIGLQLGLIYPAAIGVGAAEPASGAYFVLAVGGTSTVAFDVADGDKVYAKSLDLANATLLRGYKVVS